MTSIDVKIGSLSVPIYVFVLIISIIPCIATILLIRQKYRTYRAPNDEKFITDEEAVNVQDNENGDGNEQAKWKQKKNKKKKDIAIENQCVLKVYFLFLGFISATGWIEIVANELVNLLTTLGVISTINLDILGLTVLAWGNSVGDMIADVSVSKRGYSKMGIGAAIGGPTLNVLIGVGLGFAIKTIASSDGKVDVPTNANVFISCVGVLIGMIVYAIVVPISGWRLSKWYGYWCYFYYTAFLVVNVLVFLKVF